jgi:hypothetical protein
LPLASWAHVPSDHGGSCFGSPKSAACSVAASHTFTRVGATMWCAL